VAAVGGGGLPAYALRRLLLAVPVLFGVSLLVFAVLHLAPGDPAAIMLGAQATKEDLKRLHRDLGLDPSRSSSSTPLDRRRRRSRLPIRSLRDFARGAPRFKATHPHRGRLAIAVVLGPWRASYPR
jgi:hypothetical protein